MTRRWLGLSEACPGELRRRTQVGALALFVLMVGCDRSEPGVVLYVSADDHIARQVVRAVEQQTGIRVDTLGDTEQTKTTGLVNRLRAEKDKQPEEEK
jgi:hypothetical protein